MATSIHSTPVNHGAVTTLIRLMQELRTIDEEITARCAEVFFTIAAAPEGQIEATELKKLTGLEDAALSRNLAALTKWRKPEVHGMDLIETFTDTFDRRKKIARLNQRGKKIVAKAAGVIPAGEESKHGKAPG